MRTADTRCPTPPKRSRGMRLLLIRHGESWSNVEDVIAGERSCRGLTDRGRHQAALVAECLAAERDRTDIRIVYSTGVRRAVETAEPIAEAFGVPLRPEFPYNDHGAAEGSGRSETLSGAAGSRPLSVDGPIAPGVDSWATSARRVGRMLDVLMCRHHGDTVVLACHRETVLAAGQHFQRIPPTLDHATAEVDYTAITEWAYGPRSRDPQHWRWTLVRHNDTRHLLTM
ncbi:histidine phosphatase family protein [Nocardia macrotermitis]|uniref:2,3-bisphosphoglycerate-dependent phosphoglycerate mutase n=1 Tax=Nocardia macrotermitis TaxID=2585198 RepID=A0A7K0DB32_9NOCA|nr:histidine phosphatase family protein [Nocardia macrotermitis]MQY22731.1 2,3-bisphosphoglycerate-dependent phosphoglycerate mutase [Nocardia macrotermitis]